MTNLHGLARCVCAAAFALAPVTAPAAAPVTPSSAAPAPAQPVSPVGAIRNKISAGDLLSAQSVLEVYRDKNGQDGSWLVGLSWLARGALMLGEPGLAKEYVRQVRSQCAGRIARGATLEKDHDVEIAFGAAVEVEAQRLEHEKGAPAAAAFVRGELKDLRGPVALLARLHKRLNMLTLQGASAPELVVEDFVGAKPPSLASLKGHPVLLFLWAEGCGDCKAQSTALGRMSARYRAKGLKVLAVTRYYEEDSLRAAEKSAVDSVWKAVYSGVGEAPIVLSTASMVEYGVSSTPTFVFIDRAGIVQWYTPTRLTESELDDRLQRLTR